MSRSKRLLLLFSCYFGHLIADRACDPPSLARRCTCGWFRYPVQPAFSLNRALQNCRAYSLPAMLAKPKSVVSVSEINSSFQKLAAITAIATPLRGQAPCSIHGPRERNLILGSSAVCCPQSSGIHGSQFHNWANGVWDFGAGPGSEVAPKNFRKDIILELYNEAGHLTIASKLYRCWVSAYLAMPDLDANANAVAI